MKNSSLFFILFFTSLMLNNFSGFSQSESRATCSCNCCVVNRNPNRPVSWLCGCANEEKWKKQEQASEKQQSPSLPNRSVQQPTTQYPNPNGLTFAGTPEQQRATEKRQQEELKKQQEEWQRQKNIQDINSLTNGVVDLINGFGANQKDVERRGQETRDKITDINNQGGPKNQLRDKGNMKDAQAKSGSKDDEKPGEESDDDDKSSLLSPKVADWINHPVEGKIEELFDEEIGNKIEISGGEVVGKINNLADIVDFGKKLVNGELNPEDLRKFPTGDNFIQEFSKDAAIKNAKGKFEAMDQLATNKDNDGVPYVTPSMMNDVESQMHPIKGLPIVSEAVPIAKGALNSVRDFMNGKGGDMLDTAFAGVVFGGLVAVSAPLWTPIAVAGWLTFRP